MVVVTPTSFVVAGAPEYEAVFLMSHDVTLRPGVSYINSDNRIKGQELQHSLK